MIGVVVVNYHTNEAVVKIAKIYIGMDIIDKVVIVNNEADKVSIKALKCLEVSKKIYIFNEKKNLGYSKGNNIGCRFLVEKCGCDFVVISNSDIEITENAIKNIINNLSIYNRFAALAPVVFDENNKKVGFINYSMGYYLITYRVFLPISILNYFSSKFSNIENDIVILHYLLGSFFVCKSEALKNIDYFDENIFLYNEEFVLGERFKIAGYDEGVLLTESYLHLHPYSKEKLKTKLKKLKLELISETYYFKKYKKANRLQLTYLKIMQMFYISARLLLWKIKGNFM